MKVPVLILCVLFAGCRCAIEIGPMVDPIAPVVPAADEGMAAQNQKIKNAIAEMQRDIGAAPNDLESLNAVLRKYGIPRPRKEMK